MECESFAFPTDAKAELLHSLLQFDGGLLRMTVFYTRSATYLMPIGLPPE
jgi:hypothetical protein